MIKEAALVEIAKITPGENYPNSVTVRELDGVCVKFNLQSYVVGMYCAVYVNGQLADQTGDYNNKSFISKLVRELKKAVGRGADIDLGTILPVKKLNDRT